MSEAEAKELFEMFTKKKKDTVRSKQLGPLMRSLGKHPSNAQLVEFQESIGKDLNFEAFWKFIQTPESDATADIEEALRVQHLHSKRRRSLGNLCSHH